MVSYGNARERPTSTTLRVGLRKRPLEKSIPLPIVTIIWQDMQYEEENMKKKI